ncbi:MAG: hypothetical protein Q4G58_17175 [bacterium]|nr:hypothetical protein [bacterium]
MPTILCLVLLFCVWLRYERKKAIKIDTEAREAFMQTEKKAQVAREKDISNLDYITVPLHTLPIQKGVDCSLDEYIDSLLTISNKPIVNLSNYTNTELKLAYGIANFDLLSEYDENYFSLIHTLTSYGCSLYETKRYEDAKNILEYAVSIGSDIKLTFLTLAKIYADTKEDARIVGLENHVKEVLPEKSETLVSQIEKIRYYQYFE